MMDLVFSESAYGTLRYAQGLGRGPYRPACVGFGFENGKQPSRLRLWWMRRQYHKKEKKKWENAVVLEGKSEDAFCLALYLSIGKLSSENRETVLWNMARYDVLPEQVEAEKETVRDRLKQAQKTLNTICARLKSGESLRIWIGSSAEDRCMISWLANQLLRRNLGTAKLLLNQLPGKYQRPDGTFVSFKDWGEVEPLLWGQLDRELRQEVPTDDLVHQAQIWQQLCQENGDLRIVDNGSLRSVSADYYDARIQAEIDRQPEEFPEACVIGHLIGEGLRMPDTWIADRIERMIQAGQLTVTEEETPGVPSYRRRIRKTAVE